MARDDRALVEACLAGQAAGWDELVERYGRLVYSIPHKLGLSATDADDIFQTVFGIVLRRLETLRDVDRLSAWLIRTTYRESWRVVKARRSGHEALPTDAATEDSPTDAQLLAWERQHLVRQGLTMIDERCRVLLEALFFEDPTPPYDVLAARLDTKVGSIGPTRARCFQKLEKILRELGL